MARLRKAGGCNAACRQPSDNRPASEQNDLWPGGQSKDVVIKSDFADYAVGLAWRLSRDHKVYEEIVNFLQDTQRMMQNNQIKMKRFIIQDDGQIRASVGITIRKKGEEFFHVVCRPGHFAVKEEKGGKSHQKEEEEVSEVPEGVFPNLLASRQALSLSMLDENSLSGSALNCLSLRKLHLAACDDVSSERPVQRPVEGFRRCAERAQLAELPPVSQNWRRASGASGSCQAYASCPCGKNRSSPTSRDVVPAFNLTFDTSKIEPWNPYRFSAVRKIQDAPRSRGEVYLAYDQEVGGRPVAIKFMPNDWVLSSHDEFIKEFPFEVELPWQDIGCNSFLTDRGFQYCCSLLGVYRCEQFTAVVREFAPEGDLFDWASGNTGWFSDELSKPGSDREEALRPVVVQILQSVKALHELSIVHGDLSPENMVLSRDEWGYPHIHLIDFAMSTTARRRLACSGCGRVGKASYQAPELHGDEEYDGFLSDSFAVGVALYTLFLKAYPWRSTQPGVCTNFNFVQKYGLRAYLRHRELQDGLPVIKFLSEPLVCLLEGLLALDPAERLTLGESAFAFEFEGSRRRSVWDERWLTERLSF